MSISRSRCIPIVAGCAAMLAGSVAVAEQLGIAGLLGIPSINFNATGTTSYITQDEHFSVSASPLAIRFAPTEPPRFIDPVDDEKVLTLDIFIATNGLLVGGLFDDDDLIITGAVDADGDGNIDYSGVLLTGEIIAFGYENVGATDLFDFRFMLTGGALAPYFDGQDIGIALTVEGSTFNGSFAVDFGGGAKGIVGPIPTLTEDFSGCTPGYWRQPHHFDAWVPTGFHPDDLFSDVFGRTMPGKANMTLGQSIKLRGGHLNALARHATAALLNTAHPDVVPLPEVSTPAQVIQLFQQAFDSSDWEPTKDLFESSNEMGCPL